MTTFRSDRHRKAEPPETRQAGQTRLPVQQPVRPEDQSARQADHCRRPATRRHRRAGRAALRLPPRSRTIHRHGCQACAVTKTRSHGCRRVSATDTPIPDEIASARCGRTAMSPHRPSGPGECRIAAAVAATPESRRAASARPSPRYRSPSASGPTSAPLPEDSRWTAPARHRAENCAPMGRSAPCAARLTLRADATPRWYTRRPSHRRHRPGIEWRRNPRRQSHAARNRHAPDGASIPPETALPRESCRATYRASGRRRYPGPVAGCCRG